MAVQGGHLEEQSTRTGLSLLFAADQRPTVEAIERVLSAPDLAAPGALISHRPPEREGWLELLASGLTFELRGLAPAPAGPVEPPAHRFGTDQELSPEGLEAVTLRPGQHIAGGRAMPPVVRSMAGLAVNLALSLPVAAVCWQPARSWMAPNYFARIVVGWLSGGPFPALGLTALAQRPDGGVESVGLAYFAGQEIEIQARTGELPSDTAKLAIRMIDHVVRQGPIDRFTELDSPSGELIVAEPSHDLKRVTVRRGR